MHVLLVAWCVKLYAGQRDDFWQKLRDLFKLKFTSGIKHDVTVIIAFIAY